MRGVTLSVYWELVDHYPFAEVALYGSVSDLLNAPSATRNEHSLV